MARKERTLSELVPSIADVAGNASGEPTQQPSQPENAVARPANGTTETVTPAVANGVAEAAVAVRRAKSPRETFYLVLGETKDGTALDVLGRFETGNQARKGLEAMRMAVSRNYGRTIVVQCRDRTNV